MSDRGKLTVSRKSWHARMYEFWKGNVGRDAFDRSKEYRDGDRPENLCHYVRVILLWAPLRFLFTRQLKRFDAPAAAITLPTLLVLGIIITFIINFGAGLALLKFIGLLVLSLAVMVGFVALLENVKNRIERRRYRGEPLPAPLTAAQVVVERVRAGKQKVCPLIEVVDE